MKHQVFMLDMSLNDLIAQMEAPLGEGVARGLLAALEYFAASETWAYCEGWISGLDEPDGFLDAYVWRGAGDYTCPTDVPHHLLARPASPSALERVVEQARAEEREACADVADQLAQSALDGEEYRAAQWIALQQCSQMIRERGKE